MDPVFFIQIFIYVHLAHIMDKIEVKISDLAFFKLLFKISSTLSMLERS